MEAEGKSGQRMLRAAYHVAAAAAFRPKQSWRSPALSMVVLAPSRTEESPANLEACLIEVQAVHREIRSSLLASRQEANCWPFTAKGVRSKAAHW